MRRLPAPLPSLLALLLGAAPGLPACGRTHLLEDGPYRMTLAEVLRDDCGLLATPADLWDGDLFTAGHVVRVSYGLAGMELAGVYLAGQERFRADGTAEGVPLTLRGRACVVDQVAVTLAAGAADASGTRLAGEVSVRAFSLNRPECSCELGATLTGERGP